MKLPRLRKVGLCSVCSQKVTIQPSSFWDAPEKHEFEEKNCKGGSYTALHVIMVIDKVEEACEVATFIVGDNPQLCLLRSHGSHSLACGDGEKCNHTRHLLARALAEYYLSVFKVEPELVKIG